MPHPTQLEIWHDAYAFLAAQTTPVEIICGQFRTERGHTTVTPMRIWLVAFTDRPIHSLFLTGADTPPRPQYFKCRVNVPGSVPYRRPAINRFLARHGFVEGMRRANAPPA
ncbi:hypothetical protein GCM10028801_04760 [Nocardioides maradonensis]